MTNTAKSKVQSIITNVFDLIDEHGEDYVNEIFSEMKQNNCSENYLSAYIINETKSAFKIRHLKSISDAQKETKYYCRIAVIYLLKSFTQKSDKEIGNVVGIKSRPYVTELRNKAVELSEKIPQEKYTVEVIEKIVNKVKDNFINKH